MSGMQGMPMAPPPPPTGGPPMGGPGMMPGGPPPQMGPGGGMPRPPMMGQGGPPQMQGGPPPPPIPQPGQGAQQLAQQGRFGDSIVAHVTPGEISVPPQIQTPELIQALRQAFARAGVSLEQFTAGSPQTSHNPATGAPELSLWSALLPVLGAAAGSFIPGLGTGVGAALGGAAGGAAGGMIDKQTPMGIALSGLGGAAGGYLGAPAGAAGGGAMSAVPGGAISNAGVDALLAAPSHAVTSAAGAGGASPFSMGVGGATAAAPALAGSSVMPAAGSGLSGVGDAVKGIIPNLKAGSYAGLGASLGGMLAPPAATDPLGDAGFKRKLNPVNSNFNAVRGAPGGNVPQFAGYNPYASVSGGSPGFNFFPG